MKKIKHFGIITLLIVILTITVSFKSDFFEIAKQIEIYTAVFKELNMHYIDEINPAQLTTQSINKSLKSLDPYTHYFDEQEVEDVMISRRGSYGGIGASSSFIEKKLIVREIYEGTPAQLSGLKAGDNIIKIDDIWVKDFEGKAIHTLLKGLPDTQVAIKVKRNTATLDINITRNNIDIDPIPFYQMIDSEIGYMGLTKFNEKSFKRVTEVYKELKDEGMTKLIIDVRGNPGGLLNEVVRIVNCFVPKDKIVVTTKAKVKKWNKTYKTHEEPLDLDIPIIILIDGKSASASEILSGALQDFDRAVIMGERSFGKGLVQRYQKLPYGTQMKLTISKYYTPSGRCIQELDYTNKDSITGIVPKFNSNNMFKTANGRKVYDGGGVEPDIKIDRPLKTITTKALFKSDAIFKFALHYQNSQDKFASASAFTLADTDFDNFIDFIKTNKTSFKTKAEKSFEKAFKQAEKESYNTAIQSGYNQLLAEIKAKKMVELSINKMEISTRITDEIVKQIYFKKGVYQNKFTHDELIKKATSLLHDTNKYQKILK